MASSGTIKSSVYRSHLWLTFEWSQSSQSIADNTTTISWNLKLHWDASINFSASKSYSVTVNGSTYSGNYTGGASGSSGSKTIRSGTTTISHNTDGTKSLSMSALFNIAITWSGSYLSSMSMSGTGTLNTIPRASSISVSSGSGTKPGNGSIGLSISRASSGFTHTVNWSCGSQSGTVGTGLATSASWEVPLSLIPQSPNGNQTVTFTCYTYSGITHIGTSSCSATIGNHSPSTISGSSGSTIGSSKSFTISRSNGNFTHSMWYSFGSISWEGIGSSLTTSASFTPPMSLCSQIPNATSGSMTVILRTYYGSTQIGSDQYSYYTMSIPSSVLPSFTDISDAETESTVKTLIGAYVQNKTRLTLGIVGASGSYGSTISSYKISVAGQTINASSGTTGVITVSGEQVITATITDSRGKTATRSKTISILPYTNPKMSHVSVERNTDTSAIVIAKLSAMSLKVNSVEKNIIQYLIEYKTMDSSTYTQLKETSASLEYTLSKTILNLNESKSYEFKVYVGDVFGYNSACEIIHISTAFKSFDFDVKSGRVGIKKVLEHQDSALEMPEGSKIYIGNTAVDLDNILIFVEEK